MTALRTVALVTTISLFQASCMPVQERVRFEDQILRTTHVQLPDGEQGYRATHGEWNEGASGEVRVEQVRHCTEVEVESFERVATTTREAVRRRDLAWLFVVDVPLALGGLVAGSLLLALGDGGPEYIGTGAASLGVGAVLSVDVILALAALRDRGEEVVVAGERERSRRPAECDVAPASGLALSLSMGDQSIAIGSTDGQGVLSFDLEALVTDELLESLVLGERLVLQTGDGGRLGYFRPEPLEALADEHDWERARTTATRESYEAYLERFPSGAHADEARNALSELDEASAWRMALAADSSAGYRRYLERYPEGEHTGEARLALVFALALERDDAEGWRAFIRDNPEHPRLAEARERLRYLTADDDGDGIPNVRDYCIFWPETENDWYDEDGCPDVEPAGYGQTVGSSETVWAPRGSLDARDVVAATADAGDRDVLWFVTAGGWTYRLGVQRWSANRRGRIPVRVSRLLSLPDRLLAIAANGMLYQSLNGARSWRPVRVGGSVLTGVRDAALCGSQGRVWLATDRGLHAVGPGASSSVVAAGQGFFAVVCDGSAGVYALRAEGALVRATARGLGQAIALPASLDADALRTALLASFDSELWLAVGDRLWRRVDVEWRSIALRLRSGDVVASVRGCGTTLYLLTRRGLLLRWSNGRWVAAQPGTEGLSIRWLFSSASGVPWVLGTAGRAHLLSLGQVRERRTLGGQVLFDTGSDQPRPELIPLVESLAAAYRRHPARRISIEGHTDSRGALSMNMDLSRRDPPHP